MIEYSIPDMTCGHCAAAVERAIKSVDPTASARIDLASRKALVESVLEPSAIGASIEEAGYAVTVVGA